MEFSDERLDEIIPRLFLCDYKKAARRSILLKYQITHVLTMCADVSPPYPNDYIYKLECIDDQTVNTLQIFESTNLCDLPRFIDQALSSGGKVIVHCILGASRSAATVTAYLMWKQQLRFPDALGLVQRKHRDTDLHLFLRQQLKDYECTLVICRQFPDHAGCVFRCVNCEALIFDWSDVVVHSYESQEKPCSRFFLRHSEWRKDWSDSGEVTCYRCKHRLGHFDQDMGIVCVCRKRMNPGYLIDENTCS